MAERHPAPADPVEDWLQLWRVPGVGPLAFLRLLAHCGDAAGALRAGPEAWRAAGVTVPPPDHPPDITPDLRWLEQPGHHLLRLGEPGYPPRLAEIADPPPLLFVTGDPEVLQLPQLALVGSRHPTGAGRDTARRFAAHLARAGLVIGSGLALGIDGAAHEGALEADGLTLAVAGTGLDRVYPARHRTLAHRIAERGALLSEFPVGTGPRPGNFPRRNRVLSGLALGTLVVEAAVRSGSLITARHAAEQGREVFAIPGSIHNPLARGCHALIRGGAKLVETADDVLEELGPLIDYDALRRPPPAADAAPASPPPATDPQHAALLECIDYEPTPVDLIVQRSGLTADAVSSMLLIMELSGMVALENGGCYVRLDAEKTS